MLLREFWEVGCLRRHHAHSYILKAAWYESELIVKNVDATQTFALQRDFSFGTGTALLMYSTVSHNSVTVSKERKLTLKINSIHWICCSKQWRSAILIIMIFGKCVKLRPTKSLVNKKKNRQPVAGGAFPILEMRPKIHVCTSPLFLVNIWNVLVCTPCHP